MQIMTVITLRTVSRNGRLASGEGGNLIRLGMNAPKMLRCNREESWLRIELKKREATERERGTTKRHPPL